MVVIATVVIYVSNQIGVSVLGMFRFLCRDLWVEGREEFDICVAMYLCMDF